MQNVKGHYFYIFNWQEYAQKAKEEKSEIATLLADNEQLLTYAGKELNKARASLPGIMCVSNEDMDPKNVMWDYDLQYRH